MDVQDMTSVLTEVKQLNSQVTQLNTEGQRLRGQAEAVIQSIARELNKYNQTFGTSITRETVEAEWQLQSRKLLFEKAVVTRLVEKITKGEHTATRMSVLQELITAGVFDTTDEIMVSIITQEMDKLRNETVHTQDAVATQITMSDVTSLKSASQVPALSVPTESVAQAMAPTTEGFGFNIKPGATPGITVKPSGNVGFAFGGVQHTSPAENEASGDFKFTGFTQNTEQQAQTPVPDIPLSTEDQSASEMGEAFTPPNWGLNLQDAPAPQSDTVNESAIQNMFSGFRGVGGQKTVTGEV